MKPKIVLIWKEHSAILIMALSAISLFAINIILKEKLTVEDFGKFSLFLTVTAVVNSFGLMGAEQVVLKNCGIDVKNQKIYLSCSLKRILYLGIAFSILLGYFLSYLDLFDNIFLMILLSLLVSSLMLAYNLLRLSKKFNISQWILGGWKILTFLVVLVLFNSYEQFKFARLICFSFLFMVSFIILAYILLRDKIEIFDTGDDGVRKEDLRFLIFFLISMLTISILGQGDKFLIERKFSLADLGEYFYISTFIIFPFNFIQNYLGFKFLVDFKTSKDPRVDFRSNLGFCFGASIAVSISIVAMLYILSKMHFIDIGLFFRHNAVVLLLFITGIVKIFYSLFSSIMGSISSFSNLKKANIIYLSVMFLTLFSVYSYLNSVSSIALTLLFLWIFRLMIWGYFSHNVVKRIPMLP